jgi:hypothetical protein
MAVAFACSESQEALRLHIECSHPYLPFLAVLRNLSWDFTVQAADQGKITL